MSFLFARQPILDTKNSLFGYELLYRDGMQNSYSCTDGDMATSNVVAAGFLSLGVSEVSGNKKAFINFTESMLLHQIATLFPKEQIVIEILEDIEPREDIIHACKTLKQEGYTLALDDFVLRPCYEALIDIADIIKVDFIITKNPADRRNLVKQLGNNKTTFLAEKIENYEDFNMAVDAGYKLFQGYYFSKPVISSSKKIPPSTKNYLSLIRLFEEKDPNFEDISRIIEKDVSFSYEILRIANSAYYYRGNYVFSVREAAVRLGLEELKKWAFITSLRKIGQYNQDVIINLCAQRAKTLELLSQKIGLEEKKMEFFTLGTFSMVDALTGYPMESILPELPLSAESKQVLSGNYNESEMSACYKLIQDYEKGNWDCMSEFEDKYHIESADVVEAYREGISWAGVVS